MSMDDQEALEAGATGPVRHGPQGGDGDGSPYAGLVHGLVERGDFPVSEESPCPYLPGRMQRSNRDVTMDAAPVGGPVRDEVLAVYQRYLAYQHSESLQERGRETLEAFLYKDCVDTMEVSYRVGGRLMGVSLLDVCDRSWSSVYHFFAPEFARRSPGVFSVLAEIETCKRIGVPFYYLGYWIAGCPAMAYKANYRPCEVLIGNVWQELAGEREAARRRGPGHPQ